MHKKSQRSSPLINGLALFVGFLQPVMTIPQIVVVFEAQDASQISLLTWITYDIGSIVMLTYGLYHRLVPIIVAQILWLTVQTAMIIAALIY